MTTTTESLSPPRVDQPDSGGFEVVEQGGQRRVWNTLLHFEHPQGTTTFAGCQVRYLVVSAHGVLGAVGFSAAASQLRAVRRGWDGALSNAKPICTGCCALSRSSGLVSRSALCTVGMLDV